MRQIFDNLAGKAFAVFGDLAERVTLVRFDKTVDRVTGVATTREVTRSARMVLAPYSVDERSIEGIEVADTRGYFLGEEVGTMDPGDEIERAEGVNLDVVGVIEYPGVFEAQLRKAG